MAAVVVGSIVAASVLSGVVPSGGVRAGWPTTTATTRSRTPGAAIVLSGAADDHSYDAIENARGGIVLSGAADDHSYDAIENARGRDHQLNSTPSKPNAGDESRRSPFVRGYRPISLGVGRPGERDARRA